MIKIIETDDGSKTIISEQYKEQYHSTFGAVQESNHVFIEAGLKYCKKKDIKIFEVGFGTGLNALLTLKESLLHNLIVDYTAIELFPVDIDILNELNYKEIISINTSFCNLINNCDWNSKIKITNDFQLLKIKADLNEYEFNDKYDLIFFDAFAPDKQPEMWSIENFTKLYDALNPKGILTTYSSKGLVKNNLRKAGFTVKRLPGPIGKRHMLRAIKE